MKVKFSHFIGLAIALVTLVGFSANAQEGIPNNEIPDPIQYPELQEERPLLFEPANNNPDRSNQVKEQVIVSPKSSRAKASDGLKNPAAKPEADALSFNFLYYIIQKFKISDIVEQ
jgi:hypothetical protein